MKILLADDHTLFRDGMLSVIQDIVSCDITLLETASLQESIDILKQQPDIHLILLDLNMPGMNRTQGIQHIAQYAPQSKVIIVSACETPEIIRESIDQGAHGYIPKSAGKITMKQAIDIVLSGNIFVPPHAFVDATAGTSNDLTKRQRDVLELLAEGLSNKEIAFKLNIVERTVKMHVTELMKRLEAKNRTHIVILAQEQLPSSPNYS